MSFAQFGLLEPILKSIKEAGYTSPTSIQKQIIPLVLSGRDIMASASTGTGKTAAFSLPILHKLYQKKKQKRFSATLALILLPTRELALQVKTNIDNYANHLPFKTAIIHGGVNKSAQEKVLKEGVDIVIATTGRLIEHINDGNINLSQVEFLVLDEADRMVDMGFMEEIKIIIDHIPSQKQTMLFSATFLGAIKKMAKRLLINPIVVQSAPKRLSTKTIKQIVHPVDRKNKPALLSYLIGAGNWKQVLVFTTTKEECDNLVKNLKLDGLKSISVHGGKTQSARAKAIKAFRKKEIRILVATDIASRGIDISGLPYVINYSLPSVSEDYIHRVGRTGRAGEYGHAISLVDEYDFTYLKEIEKLIKIKIDKEIVKGFELDPNIKPISLSSQNKETQKSKPKKKTFVPPIKKKHRRTTKRG